MDSSEDNVKESSLQECADARKGSTEQSIVTKRHTSGKRDDSIYWASPPPQSSTTSAGGSATAQTGGHSPQTRIATTTITRADEELSSNHSSRSISSGSERKASNISDKSTEQSAKEAKSGEDLRFLPRTLHQSDIRPIQASGGEPSVAKYGPHTPEGDYNEDQFMPTPTQDESQSPMRSGSVSMSSRSSPLSGRSSPSLTNNTKDDVYDPEAPLQSPVDHQSGGQSSTGSPPPRRKSVTRRSVPKSPESNARAAKRSPPQTQTTVRRQNSTASDHQNKYSPKDKQKSSPNVATTSSAAHSSHQSPFKSPTVPTQRQVFQSIESICAKNSILY